MRHSYIARQPILDSNKKTVGYELLFRDGPSNTFPVIDAEHATSRLLSDHFLTTHYATLGNKLGFVNFPYQSLINKVPTLFPANNLVVEILEDCPPTAELLEAVKEMAALGYTIALDDFVPSKEWKVFLPYINIIKFDIRVVPLQKAQIFIDRLSHSGIKFLAEKVETYEEFEQAKAIGFALFQGYFFSKPEMLERKSLDPDFLTVVQLVTEVSQQEIDYKKIEALISKDVTMSYKLLTCVNSSYLVSRKIESFKQALVYLGEERLRKFVSLVALASNRDDKPDYLYGLSIQRARYSELLIREVSSRIDPSLAFITGMFSLLDSLLDRPIELIIDEIPINEAVKIALTEGTGELGQVMALIKAYELAQWDTVASYCGELHLDQDVISKCYEDSVKWTSDLLAI
ncbi:EAL and HDOD domain-containing protein [Vibrio japonicus]|uniref:HDOD domain-containing protein n=1 Tax=Vibrio japonicus TaxID=1824638 RepID=A0ABY5LCI2_9VIBR|nr:HDOD domain-containing protein [Vibrio japonicus]UUM29754.1 HDOD domain-containing protein [Vibrio japonicus]